LDAFTVVLDRKNEKFTVILARHNYTAIRPWMVLDRIANQVAKHLLERCGIR
jgi:hypothetical protein